MEKATLAELRAFAAVARHRNFRAAAEEIGVGRSSLSHAVRQLEERLGARLLHRTTRSVALTAAGAALVQRLAPLLDDLDEMLGTVADTGTPVGEIRINGVEAGTGWLLRNVVPDFLGRHPRAALDLVSDDTARDIVAEGFDAGIRLRDLVPRDMVAIPFGGPVRFLPVAAPGYLQDHPAPRSPDDLKSHRCIRQRLSSGRRYRWEFGQGSEEFAMDVPGNLTLNDNGMMVAAARKGLGIAFVPEPFAAADLRSGRLVPLLEDFSPHIDGLCLYYPGSRQLPATLKAFIAALRQADKALRPRTGAPVSYGYGD